VSKGAQELCMIPRVDNVWSYTSMFLIHLNVMLIQRTIFYLY
jgi:hypothetical protein